MTASLTHVIGVDLGGTKTAAGVVSSSGEVLVSETIPTLNRAGGEAILDATVALISGLVERAADVAKKARRLEFNQPTAKKAATKKKAAAKNPAAKTRPGERS